MSSTKQRRLAELKRLSLAYYKTLTAGGMYPGLAVSRCIALYGVGPKD